MRVALFRAFPRTYHIADAGNNAVRKLDGATGVLSTVAGVLGSRGSAGDGGPGTAAQLNYPEGLARDAATGDLYIADSASHAVRKLDGATKVLSTVAGVLGKPGSAGDEIGRAHV